MTTSWDDLVGDLEKRRDATLAMGGDERVDRQHAKGKLTVRERIGLLVDDGSFVEHGMLANHMDPQLGERSLPADGVVTGIGQIDGRSVAIAAYDFTVMGGSMGRVGEEKVARMRQMGAPTAHSDGLAAGLGGSPNSTGGRIGLCGVGGVVPRAG